MPQENKDWKEEFDNLEASYSTGAIEPLLLSQEQEVVIKKFIESLLDKQWEEITDKLHTLHANFKVEWLNNDYLEPDFDASAKKEILNAKMGLIELILTEIKK